MRFHTICGIFGLILAFTGCGSSTYAPVKGTIVYPDGGAATGLEGGTIVFETSGPDGKPVSASGAIDGQGKFILGTETVDDGALPGTHKVLISPPPATGDTPNPPVIDPKHESFQTSGIEIEVSEGSNDVKVTVEPAK